MKGLFFASKTFKSVYVWSVLSLFGPPMGWFVILLISRIVSFATLLEIVQSPFFYGYILIFFLLNYLAHRRLYVFISTHLKNGGFRSINRLGKKIPTFFLGFIWVYGILGPPAVLTGVEIDSLTYIFSWVLGPVVICVFAVPFFNFYLSNFYKFIADVPLQQEYLYSLSRRFTISFLYLVVGSISMLCLVFVHHFVSIGDGQSYDLAAQIVILGFIAMVMVVLPFTFIASRLKHRLEEVALILVNLQTGKFGQRLTIEERDQLGLVVANASELSVRLYDFVSQLRACADKLRELEKAIVAVAEKLRDGGDHQKIASQEIKSDMDQVIGQNRAASENSLNLLDRASFILQRITDGSEDMQNLKSTLQQIDEKLGSIDSLSSQTNLLAINASIEASNHADGKGFSVIASEVRKLSDNSQQISKTIKSHIAEIISKAQTSMDFYLKIEEVTRENNTKSREISDMTQEQLHLLQSLGENIDQLNRDIQMLANYAGQMDSFGKDLSNVASDISETIDYLAAGEEVN